MVGEVDSQVAGNPRPEQSARCEQRRQQGKLCWAS